MKNVIKKFKYVLMIFVMFIILTINSYWYASTESPVKAILIFNFIVMGYIGVLVLLTLYNTLHIKK